MIELWSDVEVNDGGWHEVRAQFNPSYMEVTVDGRKKSHRPELRDNRHIDLSGLLYFGGIEAVKRSRAVSQGVTAAQAAPVGQLGGLRGCLSQLELDGRRIGLPEVLETNSIQAGCLWQYPCEYILLRIQSFARLWKTASSTKFRHNVTKNVFVLHFNLSRVFRTG